jgi:hypothetical protein
VDYYLICARDEGYIGPEECERLRMQGWRIRGVLLVLLRSLREPPR